MIAQNEDEKIVLRGITCTEEIEEDFNKIAQHLKQISAWYHINAIEGEEIDQDEWESKLKDLQEIVDTQGQICALYDGLNDMMMDQINKFKQQD